MCTPQAASADYALAVLTLEGPRWRVHCHTPAALNFIKIASSPPALVCPSSAHAVRPARYTFPAACADKALAMSPEEEPRWRVAVTLPQHRASSEGLALTCNRLPIESAHGAACGVPASAVTFNVCALRLIGAGPTIVSEEACQRNAAASPFIRSRPC